MFTNLWKNYSKFILISGFRMWISDLGKWAKKSAKLLQNFNFLTFSGRVILTYLVSAFGKSEHEHLYPSEINKRALVDLHLQFDLSTLYQRTLEYFFPTIILGAPLDEAKKARLTEALGFFESMLKNKKFSTGDSFTIADLALCVTVSQIEAFEFDLYPFPKIRKWLMECTTELEPFGYQVSSIIFQTKSLY